MPRGGPSSSQFKASTQRHHASNLSNRARTQPGPPRPARPRTPAARGHPRRPELNACRSAGAFRLCHKGPVGMLRGSLPRMPDRPRRRARVQTTRRQLPPFVQEKRALFPAQSDLNPPGGGSSVSPGERTRTDRPRRRRTPTRCSAPTSRPSEAAHGRAARAREIQFGRVLDRLTVRAAAEHRVHHVVGDDRRPVTVSLVRRGVQPFEGGLPDVLPLGLRHRREEPEQQASRPAGAVHPL